MKKILVVGDVILDKYTYWTIKRLNPEGAYPLLNIIKDEFRLWGAANVAANIASLSWECDLIWLTWYDRSSEKINTLCTENNINFIDIKVKQHTIIKQRFIEKSFNSQLLRVDYEKPMIIENYDSIINILKENQYSHIIFSDYNKWFINKDLITIVKKYQLWSKIYVDTKKHNIDIFWTNITLKINFDEFKKIIWWDLKDNKENILFHLKDISKKSKSDIVVTRSEKGFISYSFNKEKHLTQWSIFDKIIDVSWAWDTFLSWLVYWDIEWNDFLESSQIANKLSWNIIWKLWTSII